jgi:glutamyl-tRNA synthetase
MSIRTRFAPSPTGNLHIGGVRTALFSWLYARRHGGAFVLRIEDTDRERSTAEFSDAIVEGMRWLGLDWDEGPHHQINRLEHYRAIAEDLIQRGLAYRCYCSREEIEAARQSQMEKGLKPRYDRRCRDNPNAERPLVDPVIRFRTPLEGTVVFDDLVRGRIAIANEELDDLVMVRGDGVPTYNFSVVVDDAEMGITHVVRGDDHINNTPRQINIFQALGAELPRFAHVPMILGPDGQRLSKRHGALSVLEYRDAGILPEALVNYLVRLGWSHGDQEIFTREEMIELFDLTDVNKAASTFNPDKLLWLNQHYIKQADNERLCNLVRDSLARRGLPTPDPATLSGVVEAQRERAQTIEEMVDKSLYFFQDFEGYDEKAANKHLTPATAGLLVALNERLASLDPWNAEAVHGAIQDTAEALDVKFGALAQPLRVAVTGGTVSPPIDITVQWVGRQRAIARLEAAVRHCGEPAAS